MKYILILGLFFNLFLSGCGTGEKKQAPSQAKDKKVVLRKDLSPFQQGVFLIKNRQYQTGVEILEKYLSDANVTGNSAEALFYLGLGYEKLGEGNKAVRRYSSAMTVASQGSPLHEKSMYRLSHVYEMQDLDGKAIATLLKLRSARTLGEEVVEIEVPARLGLAYSRMGNFNMGRRYFSRAEKRLRDFESEFHHELTPERKARLLFNMAGTKYLELARSNVQKAMIPLGLGQVYALRSVEINAQEWSEAAAKGLLDAYQSLWGAIQAHHTAPISDKKVVKSRTQLAQKRMAESLDKHLKKLLSSFVPEIRSMSPYAPLLYGHLVRIDEEVTALLEERPAREGLTEEGQKIQGIKRE